MLLSLDLRGQLITLPAPVVNMSWLYALLYITSHAIKVPFYFLLWLVGCCLNGREYLLWEILVQVFGSKLGFAVCGLTFWSVAFVRLCIVCPLSFWFVGAWCSIFCPLFSPILGAVAGLGGLKRKVMLVSKINLTTNQYHRSNWPGR